MTARLPRNPRSDAQDNHDRILDAAHAVFVADGLDVPIREIARRAEVGPATVYRHFPTKERLVAGVFTEQLRAWRSSIDEGLANPDPWNGFCVAVEKLCQLQARDRGFTAAVKSTFPHAMDFAALRTSSPTAAAELIHRAKEAGRLRPDIVLDDLTLMIMANNGIHARTSTARLAGSRRFAALMIRSFQASPLPSAPQPPTAEHLSASASRKCA
ncbi:TetR/AcrR family transcriptional regulator [Nocardia mexicana]|uniref:TetR family transcriptional regulator n=1 Tax=Nocardia mexicana TaxID=279262 RepID=A0A370H2A2_9NOCA|nr:TetR/AcrR family transcriptional regulator [Nocardia mexicana]RDI50145.1 TetR family transcriptional regulator [Nocardia mexicana]